MPTAEDIAAAAAAAAATTATVDKTLEKGTQPLKLEEANAELERTRAKLKETNHESATRRKRLEELEAAEAARKSAEMSETQKLEAKLKEANDAVAAAKAEAKDKSDKARLALMRASVLAEATAANVDPAELRSVWRDITDDPTLLAGITDRQGADGEFDGVKAAVEKVVKAHPRWLKTAEAGGIGTPLPGSGKGSGKPSPEEQKKAQEQTKDVYMREF